MPDITFPAPAPQPRVQQSPEAQSQTDTIITRDPFKTPCVCGKSFVVVAMPYVHCPNCHDTYRAHKLTPPSRCAHCDFNLMQWRRRNNMTFTNPPFA